MIIDEDIVNENMKLIFKIATYFYGVEREDLLQAGKLGLVKAFNKYDSNSGAKFSTYAYEYIYGEMYQVACRKTLKINKDTLRLYKLIEKIRYEDTQILGYIPNNEYIASKLEMDIQTIDYACMSANTLISMDDETSSYRDMHEVICDNNTINVDDKILLEDSLEKLTNEEKDVIRKRYYFDKTQSELAREFNMSQVKISRIEKKGLEKMRVLISK
ncbi:MAG: sigma-70 family RNA polymerase sigma factor [bacterium]